jgi:hypothetical protein
MQTRGIYMEREGQTPQERMSNFNISHGGEYEDDGLLGYSSVNYHCCIHKRLCLKLPRSGKMYLLLLMVGQDGAMAQEVSRRPRRGGPGSRQGQSLWDLWWTKWHWDRFHSEFFAFSLPISFHRRSSYSYLGDEQYARWWPQFRDTVCPHRHEQKQRLIIKSLKELFKSDEYKVDYIYFIIIVTSSRRSLHVQHHACCYV